MSNEATIVLTRNIIRGLHAARDALVTDGMNPDTAEQMALDTLDTSVDDAIDQFKIDCEVEA